MKSFDELYKEIYEDAPDKFKEASKFSGKKETKMLTITLVIGLFFLIIHQITSYIDIDPKIFSYIIYPIALIGIIIMSILFYVSIKMSKGKLESNDASEYKKNVINKLIKNYSEKLEYYPEKGMSEVVYQASGFDKDYEKYYSEDYITGPIFDDCLFSMAEIDVQKKKITTDASGDLVKNFHGIFVAVYLPKDTSVEINLYKKNEDYDEFINSMIEGNSSIIEEYEDKDFEQIYEVATTNQVQATRLLSLDVTQKLENFYNSSKIIPQIAIKNNVLYIRYRIKRVFDPNTLENSMDYYTLERYYDILRFTIEFTEIFVKSMLEIGD